MSSIDAAEHSRHGGLTRAQAYEALVEYLREFNRQLPEATLQYVLADLNPGVWTDSTPLDPAVPSDWSHAAALATGRAARSYGFEDDERETLPVLAWLEAVFPFLTRLRELLGLLPIREIVSILDQKDQSLPGSGSSPWELWVQATERVARRRP